jgi:hypothetical protein
LHGIGERLEDHGLRLGKLDTHLSGLRPVIAHTLSLATLNQLKVGQLEAHRDESGVWRKRMNERLDQIERRIEKAEQKLGL